MNPNPQHDTESDMNLERLLTTHLGPNALEPSSGFTVSVMDAIHRQAAPQPAEAFPPIAFPWKRLLPVAVLLVALLAVFILAAGPQLAQSAATSSHISFNFTSATTSPTAITWLWTGLSVLFSLVMAATSFKLATGRR